MASPYKLSLVSTIVLNINIMTGAGLFLNSVPFAKLGILSPMPYLTVALLMVPLIIAIAALLNYVNGGNFYTIGATLLSPFSGFLSTWSYFVAKLASASLMIHFFVTAMQQVFPQLQAINPFVADIGIIALFVLGNCLDMRIGSNILLAFVGIKSSAILSIILIGLWYFQPGNFAVPHLDWAGLASSLPLAIYAFAGFEATLSMIQHIQDPQRNGPRAVIYSYAIVVAAYCAFQLCYYAAINPTLLDSVPQFQEIAFFIQSTVTHYADLLMALLYIGIGTAALGGAYGIFFSNQWNLYALAERGHVAISKQLTIKNSAGIAYWCLIVEALACVTYLLSTHANKFLLQDISALGGMIAYSITILAFVQLTRTTLKKRWAYIISPLALASCLLMLFACIRGLHHHGPIAFFVFLGLLLVGIGMYRFTRPCSIPSRV